MKTIKTILVGLFLLIYSLNAHAFCSDGDKAILEVVWNALNTNGQPLPTNWDFSPGSELDNSWEGIDMTADGCNILKLSLQSKNLEGTIPPVLGNLGNLKHLNLSNNQLTDSIPVELGNLGNLKLLNLSNNQLTGSIPVELGNLGNLLYLRFSYNQLTGSIPVELGNLGNLQGLYLNNNQLTGCIPSSFTNLCGSAVYLASNPGLVNDNFGTFCNSQEGMCSCYENDKIILENLWLAWGSPTLANWDFTYGVELNNTWEGITMTNNGCHISQIHLNNKGLTGPIPPEIGDLEYLAIVDLSSNSLIESIPLELGNLPIITLNLQNNNLNGSIPPTLGKYKLNILEPIA